MGRRNWFPTLAWVLVLGALVLCTSPAVYARKSAGHTGTITLGYVNWAEAVAVTHLMQAVLEQNFSVDVALRLVGVEQAFQGVAKGELDAFLDVWLPSTHSKYWRKYKDRVVDLGVWYRGVATLGIAVPNYVEAEGIADLARHIEAYDGRILGIQPGSGLLRIVREQVIPAYGLEGFELTAGETAHMVAAIDRAIRNREPIAFTAWKPHWLFRAYPLRYLNDPKGVLDQSDHLHAIVREGFASDAPRVYALLNAFHLTEEQLASLELAVANARSAWGGVRRWLAEHQDVVAPWIMAASADRSDYLY